MEDVEKIIEIDIELLCAHPMQPVKRRPKQELVRSIASEGQLAPILVCPVSDGTYIILDGHCRWTAMMELGIKQAKAIVISELSEFDFQTHPLALNITQESYSPIDTARYLESLKEKLGLSDDSLAAWYRETLGENIGRSTITEIRSLTRLPEEISRAIEEGRLAYRKGVELSRLKDHPNEQALIFEKAVRYELPYVEVHALSMLVRSEAFVRHMHKRITELVLREPYFTSQHAWILHDPLAYREKLGLHDGLQLSQNERERLLRWVERYHPDIGSLIKSVRQMIKMRDKPETDAFDGLIEMLERVKRRVRKVVEEALEPTDRLKLLEFLDAFQSLQSELTEIFET